MVDEARMQAYLDMMATNSFKPAELIKAGAGTITSGNIGRDNYPTVCSYTTGYRYEESYGEGVRVLNYCEYFFDEE